MIRLFKLGTAIMCAVVASLVTILAGLFAGARYGIVALRALIGFIAAGGIVYVIAFILERYEIRLFVQAEHGAAALQHKETDQEVAVSELPADEVTESHETNQSGIDEGASDTEALDNMQEENSGEKGFTPLTTDELKHIVPPQE